MLVKDVWCWSCRNYAPGDTALEKLEAEARVTKRGLWADPHPVPPWEWSGGLLHSIGQHTIWQVRRGRTEFRNPRIRPQTPLSVREPTR